MKNSPQLPKPNPPPPSILLDGDPVELPPNLQPYLLAIHAHMETVALRRGRILETLNLSAASRQAPIKPEGKGSQNQDWDQLGRYFLKTLRKQVAVLQEKLDSAVLLVVVNEWKVAERLWAELQHDLRAAVLTLRLLQEFGGSLALNSEANSECVAQYFRELHSAWQSLDLSAGARETLSFSNELEQRLQPWLDRLDNHLKTLDEDEAVK